MDQLKVQMHLSGLSNPGSQESGAYPSCHQMRVRVFSGQVVHPSLGQHRDKGDKQRCTFTLTPTVKLETPINLSHVVFWLWERKSGRNLQEDTRSLKMTTRNIPKCCYCWWRHGNKHYWKVTVMSKANFVFVSFHFTIRKPFLLLLFNKSAQKIERKAAQLSDTINIEKDNVQYFNIYFQYFPHAVYPVLQQSTESFLLHKTFQAKHRRKHVQ